MQKFFFAPRDLTYMKIFRQPCYDFKQLSIRILGYLTLRRQYIIYSTISQYYF